MSEQSPEQPIPAEPTGATEPEQHDPASQDDQASRPGDEASSAGTSGAGHGGEEAAADTGTRHEADTAGASGAAVQTRNERANEKLPSQSGGSGSAPGRRVTRRTVHRRESEETTEETITEDLPVYQGPTSTHPAPVG